MTGFCEANPAIPTAGSLLEELAVMQASGKQHFCWLADYKFYLDLMPMIL